MRIIWITPGFAANEQDYNCIPPLQMLAKELQRQGVELHIVALEYPFISPSHHSHQLKRGIPEFKVKSQNVKCKSQKGVSGKCNLQALAIQKIVRDAISLLHFDFPILHFDFKNRVYPCNGQNRRWLRWRTLARARRFAQHIFSEKKVAAIHSFWLGPAWVIGEQLAKRWNIPHYCTLMGQDVLPANRYLKRLKQEQTSRLVALSAFHNDMLERNTGLRAEHCIPWGIEPQEHPQDFSQKRPIDILGVGSLVPVKNWVRWLEVLRLVVESRPELRAALIGGGPEQRRLQILAERFGLTKHIRFTGTLERPQVLEQMRQSRVLLHTANFESFGFVFAEAAASGCRVVSTAVGIAPNLGDCAVTDAGLAAAVLRALGQVDLHTPLILQNMRDTGQAYLDLYERQVDY